MPCTREPRLSKEEFVRHLETYYGKEFVTEELVIVPCDGCNGTFRYQGVIVDWCPGWNAVER